MPGPITEERDNQIRRLARLQDGALGIVDHGTLAGDSVALVPGCWLPIILREKRKGVYHMVGSAFILHQRGMKYLELGEGEAYPPLKFTEEEMNNLHEIVLE